MALEAGPPGEALPPAQEAVEAYRELAAANPDRYRRPGHLAVNLGVRFSALDHQPRPWLPSREAVTIRRELAAAYPDRYRPDLATSLCQPRCPVLGAGPPGRGPATGPGGSDDPPGAGCRTPTITAPIVARSLRILARALAALGRPTEAEAARREADLVR